MQGCKVKGIKGAHAWGTEVPLCAYVCRRDMIFREKFVW